MSSLQFGEKALFEKIFDMKSGYLLDFSNSSLQEFMNDFEIDLGNNKYDKYGSSKAKRFRAFWEVESDEVVTAVLKALLNYAVSLSKVSIQENENALKIINRLENNEEHRNEVKDFSTAEEQVINHRIWGTEKLRIFLSHKSEFKDETAKLKEELSLWGISCFVAHEDVEPTREWQTEIEDALFSMDILVALMTKGFQDSKWTDQEIGIAYGRKKQVVSINMGTAPYGFIGKVQAISCAWENITFELIKTLIASESTMIDVLIDLMEKCPTYEEGNRLAKCLPFLKALSTSQIDKMINIFNTNTQIHGCHGFDGQEENDYGKGLTYHINRILGKETYQINLNSWKPTISTL